MWRIRTFHAELPTDFSSYVHSLSVEVALKNPVREDFYLLGQRLNHLIHFLKQFFAIDIPPLIVEYEIIISYLLKGDFISCG
jgi:hypothetical protein